HRAGEVRPGPVLFGPRRAQEEPPRFRSTGRRVGGGGAQVCRLRLLHPVHGSLRCPADALVSLAGSKPGSLPRRVVDPAGDQIRTPAAAGAGRRQSTIILKDAEGRPSMKATSRFLLSSTPSSVRRCNLDSRVRPLVVPPAVPRDDR